MRVGLGLHQLSATARRLLTLSEVYVEPVLTSYSLSKILNTRHITSTKRNEKQTALEIAANQPQVVLLGAPGAGKSTFLHYLPRYLAKEDFDALSKWPTDLRSALPVFVGLKQFSLWMEKARHIEPPGQLLWHFILNSVRELSQIEKFLDDSFNSDRSVLIFLDGLDEVEECSARSKVCDIIANFSSIYTNCHFIVTSRDPSSLAGPLLDWPKYEFSPFSDEQQKKFLTSCRDKLFAVSSAGGGLFGQHFSLLILGRELEEERKNPEMQNLSKVPMLLTLLVWIYAETGQLPIARALLVEKALNLLWNLEAVKSKDKEEAAQFSALWDKARSMEVLRIQLDKLAFEGELQQSTGSGSSISESRALEIVSEAHSEGSRDWAREVLLALKTHTGLIDYEQREGVSFLHNGFRECMAGLHLARQKNFWQQALDLSLAGDGLWSEPILFAVNYLSYSQLEQERPLVLIDALSHAFEVPKSDRDWLRIAQAGALFLELDRDKATEIPLGKRLLDRVRYQLAALVESGALTATGRARVGDNLGMLGDPRFEADSPRLPTVFQGKSELFRGFVEIPPGSFVMGGISGEADALEAELGNSGPVEVPYRYWIGRYPVTVGQFAAFIDEGGYDWKPFWLPIGWEWRNVTSPKAFSSDDPKRWLQEFLDLRPGSLRNRPAYWDEQKFYGNRPVGGISWFEARAYASWLDGKVRAELPSAEYCVRLSTEDEWEKAARLHEPRKYPWGREDWSAARSNTLKSEIRHATTVGMYPAGASAPGILDLAGNVEEWTLSRYQRYPYDAWDGRNRIEPVYEPRVLRGGSFLTDVSETRCSARKFDYPNVSELRHGFRVVVSVRLDEAS